jgi:hypothetical protein
MSYRVVLLFSSSIEINLPISNETGLEVWWVSEDEGGIYNVIWGS